MLLILFIILCVIMLLLVALKDSEKTSQIIDQSAFNLSSKTTEYSTDSGIVTVDVGFEKRKHAALQFLKAIGENPEREGLIDTPKRIAKMWEEIYRGYNTEPPKITTFPNGNDGINYDQMIIDTGYFYSTCEHHAAPFFGEYFFAYVPKKKILGLSKVARVVDYFSAKLQVQERLTKEIVDYIENVVEPEGIALVIKGRHLCKEMRGVKKHSGIMSTSEVRGGFRTNSKLREEFLQLIK